MPSKPKKLPATIYAIWNNDSLTDPPFIQADDDPQGLIDKGETLTVGVYQLAGTTEVSNKTTVKAAPIVKPKKSRSRR